MKDKLYNAFVEATRNVFNLMLNISDISHHPAEDFQCDDEVDIAIGIVGNLDGEVVFRFPVSTSLNMVRIMSGMEFAEVDLFVTSAISEIANIISGNVLTALSDSELQCNLLPPVQYEIDNDKKYDLETSSCLGTAIGEICLEIRLNRPS